MKWPTMTLSAPGEVHLLSRQILQRAEQMDTGVITAVQFLQRQMWTNCSGEKCYDVYYWHLGYNLHEVNT